MSRRFGRNQRRRMRETISDLEQTVKVNQRACSEQYSRAERLAAEMRRSILIELVPLPDNLESQSVPLRATARYAGITLSQQHNVAQQELCMSLSNPERRAEYCRKLAILMFERLSRA